MVKKRILWFTGLPRSGKSSLAKKVPTISILVDLPLTNFLVDNINELN